MTCKPTKEEIEAIRKRALYLLMNYHGEEVPHHHEKILINMGFKAGEKYETAEAYMKLNNIRLQRDMAWDKSKGLKRAYAENISEIRKLKKEVTNLRRMLELSGVCPDCGGLIIIRNPTGECDHLYYPEYKNKKEEK